MKILLTTLNSKYIHTALSLRYIESYVKSNSNHSVFIEEYTINQNINYIIGEIYRKDFDVIAFSVYIWNANQVYDIVRALKMVKPDIKVILGGPEVSFDIEELMQRENAIDYLVYGEGEVTFLELIDSIENNSDLGRVLGLAYRRKDKVFVNPPRMEILDLDTIPEVYKSDLSEYENKIIYYESSRGCPFNCKFCLSSTIRGVRYFGLDRVKRDLKKFLDAKVKQVKFIDRTFNASKSHALEIMRFISKNDNGYTNFHFEVTAHLIDDEIMDFLSTASVGLFQFEIGVQSTNEKTTVAINRTTDFKQLSKVVSRLKRYENIHLHLDLIAGLPYESYLSFGRSFDHVYSLKPEKLQLGFLKLLRGSEMRDETDIHAFKYLDKPPYEILENRYISYKEILKLRDIEELVDIYGNEYRFKHSLEYIMEDVYSSYFEFYEDFSKYWRDNGLYNTSHGKVSQYRVLVDFFGEKRPDDMDIFREVVRYDFIGDTKSPNVPSFMRSERELSKDEKYRILKSEQIRADIFPAVDQRNYNNIHKFVYIDEFKYNILKKKADRRVYLFDYRVDARELKNSYIIDITDYREEI